MSFGDKGGERAISKIAVSMTTCAHCNKPKRESEGVKRGFRMVHAACARKYDQDTARRSEGPQGPFTVTVLPDCRDTYGNIPWTTEVHPRRSREIRTES